MPSAEMHGHGQTLVNLDRKVNCQNPFLENPKLMLTTDDFDSEGTYLMTFLGCLLPKHALLE